MWAKNKRGYAMVALGVFLIAIQVVAVFGATYGARVLARSEGAATVLQGLKTVVTSVAIRGTSRAIELAQQFTPLHQVESWVREVPSALAGAENKRGEKCWIMVGGGSLVGVEMTSKSCVVRTGLPNGVTDCPVRCEPQSALDRCQVSGIKVSAPI